MVEIYDIILHVYSDSQQVIQLFFLSSEFQAFKECIEAELMKFPEEVRDEVVILFSAHSLPLKVGTQSFTHKCVSKQFTVIHTVL